MDMKTLKDIPPWDWPEDASKMILEVLRDDWADESDRLLAAELGGDSVVVNDEIAGALLSIVQSGNEVEEIRGRSAIAFGAALANAQLFGFEDPDDIVISEEVFRDVQESFHELFADAEVPKYVRRRILEASVRAPQDWHEGVIREAYSSNDEDWKLTAVFCMRYVEGFDDLILDALGSKNPDIHYEAVCAAGSWEVDAAWEHVTSLISAEETDKHLLLAAIEAVGSIRPEEAPEILGDLLESDDEDIAAAAFEALATAEELVGTKEEERPMARQRNGNPASPEQRIEARIDQLIAESRRHCEEVIAHHPEVADMKGEIFQAWAIQKIAGLQLCVEEIAMRFNMFLQRYAGETMGLDRDLMEYLREMTSRKPGKEPKMPGRRDET